MMDDIQILAARAALSKMARNGYVCICTIDNILKMSGGIPNAKDYQTLRTLHCVSFSEMPPELLRGIPLLIKRVLESDSIEFAFEGNELRFIDAQSK